MTTAPAAPAKSASTLPSIKPELFASLLERGGGKILVAGQVRGTAYDSKDERSGVLYSVIGLSFWGGELSVRLKHGSESARVLEKTPDQSVLCLVDAKFFKNKDGSGFKRDWDAEADVIAIEGS